MSDLNAFDPAQLIELVRRDPEAGRQAVRAAMLARISEDPRVAALIGLLGQQPTASAEVAVEVEPRRDSSRAARIRARVQEMREELEELHRRNEDLADALGACAVCWGRTASCEECRGRGVPRLALAGPEVVRGVGGACPENERRKVMSVYTLDEDIDEAEDEDIEDALREDYDLSERRKRRGPRGRGYAKPRIEKSFVTNTQLLATTTRIGQDIRQLSGNIKAVESRVVRTGQGAAQNMQMMALLPLLTKKTFTLTAAAGGMPADTKVVIDDGNILTIMLPMMMMMMGGMGGGVSNPSQGGMDPMMMMMMILIIPSLTPKATP